MLTTRTRHMTCEYLVILYYSYLTTPMITSAITPTSTPPTTSGPQLQRSLSTRAPRSHGRGPLSPSEDPDQRPRYGYEWAGLTISLLLQCSSSSTHRTTTTALSGSFHQPFTRQAPSRSTFSHPTRSRLGEGVVIGCGFMYILSLDHLVRPHKAQHTKDWDNNRPTASSKD